jgi:hypothetical protein
MAGVYAFWAFHPETESRMSLLSSSGSGGRPGVWARLLAAPTPALDVIRRLTHDAPAATSPRITLSIAEQFGWWLRQTRQLTGLTRRNGYALLGWMARVSLLGNVPESSGLLREELVFHYQQAPSVSDRQDLLQHLTDYWHVALHPAASAPAGELLYGLFFLSQEARQMAPLSTNAAGYYLQLAMAVRRERPELSPALPHMEDLALAAHSGWENLAWVQERPLPTVLEVLDIKRRQWEPSPLLNRLLDMGHEFLEEQKEQWRQVLSQLSDWACQPATQRHQPEAVERITRFIEHLQGSGLMQNECQSYLARLQPSVPSATPPCPMPSSNNITF